jgi:hypothetical protein
VANERDLFQAAFQSVVEEMRSSLGEHPDPEDLLAYHSGQVSDEEADRVREHLALCPTCCDLLLAMESFREFEGETSAEEAAEKAAIWRRLKESISQEKTWLAAGLSPCSRVPYFRRAAIPWALAASLFLAVLGLSAHVASLQKQVKDLSAGPKVVTLVDLLPEGERVRGAETGEIQISKDTPEVVLILNLVDSRPFRSYKVALMDNAKTIWETAELRPAPDGYFALSVPREGLPADSRRLQVDLYGQADGQEELVATYPVRFQ